MRRIWCLLALISASCGTEPPADPLGEKTTHAKDVETDSVIGGGPFAIAWFYKKPGEVPAAEVTGDAKEILVVDHNDEFHFSEETRISLEVKFIPEITSRLNTTHGREGYFRKRIKEPCIRLLRKAGRESSIFAHPGQIEDDGVNILVKLMIGPNTNGTPYRVSLSARQDAAYWSAYVERPTYRKVPGNIPIMPGDKTADGRPYWEPGRDTAALADRLCDHILKAA